MYLTLYRVIEVNRKSFRRYALDVFENENHWLDDATRIIDSISLGR